jgi:quercetin dioxygenase-like cupin family protein
MRAWLLGWAMMVAGITPSVAQAQATTRQCGAVEEAGPACLLAHALLAQLPEGKIYWHIDRFPSRVLAERAGMPTSAVVDAFGSTWLFTLAKAGWRSKGGEHLSRIGPLPVVPASSYNAEYLRSIFTPGTTAPLHVHSGPEVFYAVSGDTCLETPGGMQIGRGPGNSLMIKAGPPMLLMAIGKVPRRGFALILHDSHQPPTTLTQAWQPEGLCARQLSLDQRP